MPVKIKIDAQKCGARVMTAWEAGLPVLSSQILGDCNQYVKRDRGTLEASSYAHSRLTEGVLVWATPYAARQYWEIQTSLTPGRTWKWCETAKRRHLSEWQRIAEKGLKDNL